MTLTSSARGPKWTIFLPSPFRRRSLTTRSRRLLLVRRLSRAIFLRSRQDGSVPHCFPLLPHPTWVLLRRRCRTGIVPLATGDHDHNTFFFPFPLLGASSVSGPIFHLTEHGTLRQPTPELFLSCQSIFPFASRRML